MTTANGIKDQINRLVECLVGIGLADDQNPSFVRQLSGKQFEVTFPKSHYVTAALKDRSYEDIYIQLNTERAFTIKLPDGALLLLRYLFNDDRGLERHSLGFYPSPHLEEFQNYPELYLEDVIYADVVARNIVPFPIRFDFDDRDGVHSPLKHPRSHLTLGQYENCRIPVSAPLSPYWFLAFVLQNFYHTAFACYAKDLPVFRDEFEDCIHPIERTVVHIQLPWKAKA